jgi:hypothetical protein
MADKNGSASDSGLSGPCFPTSRPPDPPNLSRHRHLGLGGRRDTLRLAPAEELGVSLEEKLVCIHGDKSNTTISPPEYSTLCLVRKGTGNFWQTQSSLVP